MSRFGAGTGAFLGAILGGGAASMGAAYVVEQDPDEPDDAVYYRKASDVNLAGVLGIIAGATIGAAVGAGSSAPKQIGVGALPNQMGGGLFP